MTEFRRRIDLSVGWAEYDVMDQVRVGDRVVGRLIDVEFPGMEGQPGLTMTIDSSSGIPRCKDVHLFTVKDGREIRTTDLRAVKIDDWIEAIFAASADLIVSESSDGRTSIVNVSATDSADARAARATLNQARRGARRKVTPDLLRRVAEVYLKDDLRPAEAVELAFSVAPRTAFRYIALAREQGFLPRRGPFDRAEGMS